MVTENSVLGTTARVLAAFPAAAGAQIADADNDGLPDVVEQQLGTQTAVADAQGSIFDATLVLERRPIDGAALTRFLLNYPALTPQVALKLYWNALLIRLKRNPFHDHPPTSKADRR